MEETSGSSAKKTRFLKEKSEAKKDITFETC